MPSTTPAIEADEPRKRIPFQESALPGEPATDRKLIVAGGMKLRERMTRVDTHNGYSLSFRSTRLDADGNVVLDEKGSPILSPEMGITITGEAAARIGSAAALKQTIDETREEAAAMAADHFAGLEILEAAIGDRVPPSPIPVRQ